MKKRIVLKIDGMHCVSCSMNIDGELEDTEGVFSSNTNYAKQKAEVEFDTSKVSHDRIIGIIKDLGYEAELDQAN